MADVELAAEPAIAPPLHDQDDDLIDYDTETEHHLGDDDEVPVATTKEYNEPTDLGAQAAQAPSQADNDTQLEQGPIAGTTQEFDVVQDENQDDADFVDMGADMPEASDQNLLIEQPGQEGNDIEYDFGDGNAKITELNNVEASPNEAPAQGISEAEHFLNQDVETERETKDEQEAGDEIDWAEHDTSGFENKDAGLEQTLTSVAGEPENMGEFVENENETEAMQDNLDVEDVGPDFGSPAGVEETAARAEEVQALQEAVPEKFEPHAEEGSQSESTSHTHSQDDDFPDIVVHYKGDEFPCFSHGSDGFFSDTAILDSSMESVLAGFRAELDEEISPQDELVFQVDELGLEYAESHSSTLLSSTTLRQLLEIFDLLVKTQDPDKSKQLYAYLFTKPSTEKRYEWLAETAAAGKGLDEVTHLFDPPSATPVVASEAALDALFEGHLDEYESVHDETRDQMEGEEEKNPQYAEDHDAEIVEEGNSHVPSAEQTDAVANDAAFEAFMEDAGTEQAVVQDEAAHPGEVGETEAPEQIDLSSTFENEVGDPVSYEGLDLTADHEELGEEINNNETAAELLQHDDVLDFNGDANVAGNDQSENAIEEQPVDDDELNEIDWRDDPVPEATISDTTSSTGKRPRADDTADVAEEQDVKRRRP